MTAPQLITSLQNPKIKHLLLLQQKSAERRRCALFVVEGRRELSHCLAAGYQVDSLFLLDGHFPEGDLLRPSHRGLQTAHAYAVPSAVYERIAYRGTTEGVVAIVHSRQRTLSQLLPPPHATTANVQPVDCNVGHDAEQGLSAKPAHELTARPQTSSPLFIVLESVEKPGNLGAVLRTADAAAATGVIVCDPLTDLYNPNLIRASIGACFTVPTVACTTDDCIAFLKANGIQILTAQLQDSSCYYDTDMTRPTAIVMGTEATGLTEAWRQAADAHIRIPMLGQLDSLNVSVSTAILAFEAVRQRQPRTS